MTTMADVRFQMRMLGYSGLMLKRGEVRELPSLMREGEIIQQAIYGQYSSGFGMLVATNQRLLFVDRRFFHRHFTDIPYDGISAVDMDCGLFTACISIHASNGVTELKGLSVARAREFFNYIDERIEQHN